MRIYLAKSNAVDPTTYIKVKGLLSLINDNIECVEWKAGNNDPKELRESDFLLVMTADVFPAVERDGIKGYFVGRGIYGQIETFLLSHGPEYVLVVNQVLSTQEFQTKIVVNQFKSIKVHDTNDWKRNYGKCTVFDKELMLHYCLSGHNPDWPVSPEPVETYEDQAHRTFMITNTKNNQPKDTVMFLRPDGTEVDIDEMSDEEVRTAFKNFVRNLNSMFPE